MTILMNDMVCIRQRACHDHFRPHQKIQMIRRTARDDVFFAPEFRAAHRLQCHYIMRNFRRLPHQDLSRYRALFPVDRFGVGIDRQNMNPAALYRRLAVHRHQSVFL